MQPTRQTRGGKESGDKAGERNRFLCNFDREEVVGMPKERKYTWYIQPQNSDTNAALGGAFPAENFYEGMRDEHGTPRNVWECDPESFRAFVSSKGRMGLRFRCFVREGNGKMREMPFSFFGKKAKASVPAKINSAIAAAAAAS